MTPTKDQQAQEYAEKKLKAFSEGALQPNDVIADYFDFYDVRDAFEDGYTACEQSMWRSVEEELPEDDRLVFAHFSDVDPELCYATAYYKDGAWQTPDDWYYDCKIDFWKPIMPPSLPETNTEKIFTLILPVFKGVAAQTLQVEVYVNPADLSCTLVSPEANDIVATSRDSLIDSVIERIKTVTPDIVVIEK